MARLHVEAHFYEVHPAGVFDRFIAGLEQFGFTQLQPLPRRLFHSWDDVVFDDTPVMVSLRRTRDKKHCHAEIRSFNDDAALCLAFENLFTHFFNHAWDDGLAELLFSRRNPQPYPFLTYPFHRTWHAPTIVEREQDDERTSPGDTSYWRRLGPELHFIANSVFARAEMDAATLSQRLGAEIIAVENGSIFDCGWTQEFELLSVVQTNRINREST